MEAGEDGTLARRLSVTYSIASLPFGVAASFAL